MSYTSRTRNGYRVLVAAVTGALSLGSLTVTGLVAGQAAADHNDQLAAKALKEREAQEKYERDKAAYEAALAAAEPQVIWKKRPVKKRVSIRYIQAGGSSLGGGGSVGSGGSGGSGGGGNSSGGGGGSSSGAGTPPPPPPPPPPSSGS